MFELLSSALTGGIDKTELHNSCSVGRLEMCSVEHGRKPYDGDNV